eukprot:TRINITY_DN1656_c2_g1_i2.p1 TRINITY_DN1656_c2_g1~~TRINITY_DN1656_c2_g1_i2.p1  ORF type:complete len:482 (-),score=173.61 TRINITY_DN1656_c2_g1_i2:643-2088(-)
MKYRADGKALGEVTELDLSDRLVPFIDTQVWGQLTALESLDLTGNLISMEMLTEIAGCVPSLKSIQIHFNTQFGVNKESIRKLFEGSNLVAINGEDINEPEVDYHKMQVDGVLKSMWKYNNTYRILTENTQDDSDTQWVWYTMDDLGSRFDHSLTPNFQFAPFMYVDASTGQQTTYSIAWPIEDCVPMQPVTRNYLSGIDMDDPQFLYRQLAWFDASNPFHFPEEFAAKLEQQIQDAEEMQAKIESGEEGESTLDQAAVEQVTSGGAVDRQTTDSGPGGDQSLSSTKNVLKVFTDMRLVLDNLTSTTFELVKTPEEADVLWLVSHFEFFKEEYDKFSLANSTGDDEWKPLELGENQYLNQFEGEECINTKDFLFGTIYSYFGQSVSWLPRSFNLSTNLADFVGEYKRRERLIEQNATDEHDHPVDNVWIVKPSSLSRGIDIMVSDDMGCIVRQLECGPRMVSKCKLRGGEKGEEEQTDTWF